jgi:hypothetical protein
VGRVRLLLASLALTGAGCQQLFGLDQPRRPDAATIDGSGSDSSDCYGTGVYTICLQSPPPPPISFTPGQTIVTADVCSNERWSNVNQPDSCIVVATMLTVPSIAVRGSRPLVLLATDSLTVEGTIDAASHAGDIIGPASPSPDCQSGLQPQNGVKGAGGGAGGSFVALGADGGFGNAGSNNGGTAGSPIAATRLQAGCDGQVGGVGSSTGAVSGHGGGALVLIAGGTLTLRSAIINVSGSGGHSAGVAEGGGGGGGSGGMLVLNAPAIVDDKSSIVIANGGGGGGGGGGTAGPDGADPDPSAPTTTAAGGGASCGNNAGGHGAVVVTAPQAGNDGSGNCGGGGGGGGIGYIQANHPLVNATASPVVTIVP